VGVAVPVPFCVTGAPQTDSPQSLYSKNPSAVLQRTNSPPTSSCTQASKFRSVNWVLAVLPELSVAVHVTSVGPLGNEEPEAGVHKNVTPGQLSDAVGGG
jgi:hypothetical protein